MNLFELLSVAFMLGGAFFLMVGSIGLIRLPDFYCRSHATAKSDTLGIMLMILGMIFYEGLTLNSAKLLIILSFVALTNPTATHALARAAFLFGLKPRFTAGKTKRKKGA